ncbi:hypothetical protein GCM10023331_24400 [Algivirga pacifica]|uniref:DUF4154 domain-containing protein n=1 Tax=Algivirga pacifica TaxID=1162670 RepID=A0ABP9DCI0_9BACT
MVGQAQYTEYERKAGMIYTFGRLVTWPEHAWKEADHLVLGILGDDPFGQVIDDVLKNRPIKGKTWEIRRGRAVEEVRGAHIIFVSNAYSKQEVKEILRQIYSRRNAMVLTIGDQIDRFCEIGGVINLTENLYTLNVMAANRAQLTINVNLLRLASDIIPYDPDDSYENGY